MKLRKFKSNSTDLKFLWKEHGINFEEDILEQNLSKVLGIIWTTEIDTLKIDIQPLLVGFDKIITKRLVLQTVAKTYDPIGLIFPFLVRIKFLMGAQFWEQGIDWDSTLLDPLSEKFRKWHYEI